MDTPGQAPIGLQLNQTARLVGQEFDRALAEAGGSLPVWLVLLSLSNGASATQRELAGVIGITEGTLSYHLAAMERDGLITRERNTSNRRVHDVRLTDAGVARFQALRVAAVAFDKRVNRGLTTDDRTRFREILDLIVRNLDDKPRSGPAWAGIGPTALAAANNTAAAQTAPEPLDEGGRND